MLRLIFFFWQLDVIYSLLVFAVLAAESLLEFRHRWGGLARSLAMV